MMKKDCSKTANYLVEKHRMCDLNSCSDCPLGDRNNGENVGGCAPFERLFPDKAAEIVQKWSDEHKQKTYVEDFFEKFPNSPKIWKIGTPVAAWCHIYGMRGKYTCDGDCAACWSQIMEDKPDEEKENLW